MGKVADESTRGAAGRNDEASSLWSRTIDRPGGRLYACIVLMAVALALAVTLAVAVRRHWRRQASAG
jgi:hypothetical protein